jgi:hypothetical protein
VFHLESGVALVMSKIPDRMIAAGALVRRVPGDDDDDDEDEDEDEDDEKHPDEDEDEGDGYSE